MINATLEQAQTLVAANRRAKLLRMLQSILRKNPRASLAKSAAGFGAYTGEGNFLYISLKGAWNGADLSDWLVLFAGWLRVDPDRLLVADDTGGDGVSVMEKHLADYSGGRSERNLLGLCTHCERRWKVWTPFCQECGYGLTPVEKWD